MPGLLRGVARTAVIAGTATSVSNRVSRRQANRWQQQEGYYEEQPQQEPQQYAPPPAAAPAPDPIARLKELGSLHERGILTEGEFPAQKAKIRGWPAGGAGSSGRIDPPPAPPLLSPHRA